jgi:hypothetical protein
MDEQGPQQKVLKRKGQNLARVQKIPPSQGQVAKLRSQILWWDPQNQATDHPDRAHIP